MNGDLDRCHRPGLPRRAPGYLPVGTTVYVKYGRDAAQRASQTVSRAQALRKLKLRIWKRMSCGLKTWPCGRTRIDQCAAGIYLFTGTPYWIQWQRGQLSSTLHHEISIGGENRFCKAESTGCSVIQSYSIAYHDEDHEGGRPSSLPGVGLY